MNAFDRARIQELRIASIERRLDRAGALHMTMFCVPYLAILAAGVAALVHLTPAVWGFAAEGNLLLAAVGAVCFLWVFGAPAVYFTAMFIGQVIGEHMRQEVERLQQQVRDEERRLRSYVDML